MFHTLRDRIAELGAGQVRLLAVSKTKPASAVRDLYVLGQRAFGENYVQEALEKQRALSDLTDLEWHLIGPLQSNKAAQVARHFDWLQSLDRPKLVPMLAAGRPPDRAPLNVLIQVNIDDEGSKSGCAPDDVGSLAATIVAEPRLCLRGLMAIPRPYPELAQRRPAFDAMATLWRGLQGRYPTVDTLSLGMSEDYALAIACGATMVRIGSALFGAR